MSSLRKTTDFLSGTHQVNKSKSIQVSVRQADQSVLSTHMTSGWRHSVSFVEVKHVHETNICFISTSDVTWLDWAGECVGGTLKYWSSDESIDQCRQTLNSFEEVKLNRVIEYNQEVLTYSVRVRKPWPQEITFNQENNLDTCFTKSCTVPEYVLGYFSRLHCRVTLMIQINSAASISDFRLYNASCFHGNGRDVQECHTWGRNLFTMMPCTPGRWWWVMWPNTVRRNRQAACKS